jgi:hypothetical protein
MILGDLRAPSDDHAQVAVEQPVPSRSARPPSPGLLPPARSETCERGLDYPRKSRAGRSVTSSLERQSSTTPGKTKSGSQVERASSEPVALSTGRGSLGAIMLSDSLRAVSVVDPQTHLDSTASDLFAPIVRARAQTP